MRLAVVAHVALVEDFFEFAVVFCGDEVFNGLAEVPKELVAGFRALDDLAGQDGQPRGGVISAQTFEVGEDVAGPILRAGLPAVVDDVMDALMPRSE